MDKDLDAIYILDNYVVVDTTRRKVCEISNPIYNNMFRGNKFANEMATLLVEYRNKAMELERKLKLSISLPIPIGEECWTINCWCEYGDAKKGEPYTVTRYELHENIVSGYEIYKSMINNELTLNVVPRAETNYKGVQPYLFATKEEAELKLKELKGEKMAKIKALNIWVCCSECSHTYFALRKKCPVCGSEDWYNPSDFK